MMAFFKLVSPDPQLMHSFQLDDYAAAWARRLALPQGSFERDVDEADAAYRPRLLGMLRDTVEAP